ncbi:MAG: helix-turn-helix transcriptional regulator [Isosphaeraceae bacterium]
MISLAQRVRDFRYAKGWGPDELASRAEISRTALYQIESGKTGLPRAGTLRRIAVALDVSMDDLLGHLDGSPHLAGNSQPQVRPVLDHAAVSGRPRDVENWLPSEGLPLTVPGQSAYSGYAPHQQARDELRADDQRPTQDLLRIRPAASPDSLLVREGELMSKLHDLLHSPLGQGIARIIEELHQILPRSRNLP